MDDLSDRESSLALDPETALRSDFGLWMPSSAGSVIVAGGQCVVPWLVKVVLSSSGSASRGIIRWARVIRCS